MARGARNARMLGAIERVLDADERIVGRGRCWAATRRPRVPLLLLGRHQYDVVLTDRRVMLFSRRRRKLRSDDVALAKRFGALTLGAQRQRVPLLQQRIRTDNGAEFVVEWQPRHRALGRLLADALTRDAVRA